MRHRVLLALAAFACSASACRPSPPNDRPPTITVDPTAAPSAPASSAPGVQRTPAGDWQGPPCPSRKYVRNLAFASDGSFAATDLVSPCPPGARCVWSGIILWNGTWKLQDDRILLEPDRSGRLPDRVPEALTMDGGVLVESAAPECRYARAR